MALQIQPIHEMQQRIINRKNRCESSAVNNSSRSEWRKSAVVAQASWLAAVSPTLRVGEGLAIVDVLNSNICLRLPESTLNDSVSEEMATKGQKPCSQ